MSQAGLSDVVEEAASGPKRSFGDRVFDALPVAPVWAGVLAAMVLLALFATLAELTGGFERLRAAGTPLWQTRDARGGLIYALLLVYNPVAHRYATLALRRSFETLSPLLLVHCGPAKTRELRAATLGGFPPRGRALAATLGIAITPAVAFAIDRSFALYLRPDYWTSEHVWNWAVGILLAMSLGLFVHATIVYSRRLSQLAEHLPAVDLLDLSSLAPFARMGQQLTLLWLVAAGIFALNVVDRGYFVAVFVITLISVSLASAAVVLPARGAHRRIREAKQSELARVEAALRGDVHALRDSPIAARAAQAGVADLLAWRSFVEGVREWPFDAPMRARLLLYVGIPLGSWIGGALVERLLDLTLS